MCPIRDHDDFSRRTDRNEKRIGGRHRIDCFQQNRPGAADHEDLLLAVVCLAFVDPVQFRASGASVAICCPSVARIVSYVCNVVICRPSDARQSDGVTWPIQLRLISGDKTV